jgi:hypothetical protein
VAAVRSLLRWFLHKLAVFIQMISFEDIRHLKQLYFPEPVLQLSVSKRNHCIWHPCWTSVMFANIFLMLCSPPKPERLPRIHCYISYHVPRQGVVKKKGSLCYMYHYHNYRQGVVSSKVRNIANCICLITSVSSGPADSHSWLILLCVQYCMARRSKIYWAQSQWNIRSQYVERQFHRRRAWRVHHARLPGPISQPQILPSL